MPSPEQVRAWQALRGRFLAALWDAEAEGDDWPKVADALGAAGGAFLPPADIERLTRTLMDDGLIDDRMGYAEAQASQTQLTPAGRAEVERWISDPDVATEHLPVPANIVIYNHGTWQASPVVQASPGASITAISNVHQQLANFAQQFEAQVAYLDLDDAEREEVEADLATLQEQSTALEGPQTSRWRPSVRRLTAWMGKTVADGVGAVAKDSIVKLGNELLQIPGL